MLIGKQGKTTSGIRTGVAHGTTIRGRILRGEPIGLRMPHEADPA